MVTLYRKYRPTNFKEVVSQNHVKITIENQIKTNSIGHAYLFCGPRAVGKTTISRVLAKSLNCTERQSDSSEPCNQCHTCKEISNNAGLDIIEIDAASHTGVDNVRENIINMAHVSPSNYKYKVFIIDEVHMLSISAFNALLKIMEEPPSYIIFILCTTETHKVPQTIISRCQRFNFKKISVSDITDKLLYITKKEDIKVSKPILESIARQSGGHMRDAESLLSQVIAVSGKEVTQEEADLVIPRSSINEVIQLIQLLSEKNTIDSIQLINRNMDDGIDLKIFINETIETLRKIALTKTSPILAEKLGIELGETLEKQVNSISNSLNLEFILRAINEFKTANQELDNYPIPQMSLELAVIILTQSQSTTPQIQPAAQPNTQNQTPIIQQNQPTPIETPTLPPTPQVTEQNTSTPTNTENPPINDTKTDTQPATQPAPTPTTSNPINLAQIESRWSEILKTLQNTSPSISFVLRACQPHSIVNNQLTLAFKYKFHKDQADKPESSLIIVEALKNTFNAEFTLECILETEATPPQTPPTESISPQTPTPEPTPPQTPQEAKPEPQKTPQEPTPSENTPNNPPEGNQDTTDAKMVNDILNTFGGKIVG